jgi:hypothetical protein
MTPRQVDELTPGEYHAMLVYVDKSQREQRRAERKAARKRG